MYAHPGKKLLFMGSEIGDWNEWSHDRALPWELLQFDNHRKLQDYVRALNALYHANPAMYEVDFSYTGFEWVDFHDVEGSIISFLRRAGDGRFILFVCNFTPVPRWRYRVGAPDPGFYREVLNSDSDLFGGSNMGNAGGVMAEAVPAHGRPHSISITIPPLAVLAFER
jgi:1,4-alpha-glucan branching enzyme